MRNNNWLEAMNLRPKKLVSQLKLRGEHEKNKKRKIVPLQKVYRSSEVKQVPHMKS